MTKAELNKVVSDAVSEVMKKNADVIQNQIRSAFVSKEENGQISAMDAATCGTALCLSLLPGISAAVTARILVDLGLVPLEGDE